MEPSRRSLFGLLLGAPAVALAQAPQVNATTQLKNLPAAPASGGDNWQAFPAVGAANGTNPTFTIAAVAAQKKVSVYLNGLRQAQASEVATPILPNFSVAFQAAASGAGVVVTFLSPIPQTGDSVVIEIA